MQPSEELLMQVLLVSLILVCLCCLVWASTLCEKLWLAVAWTAEMVLYAATQCVAQRPQLLQLHHQTPFLRGGLQPSHLRCLRPVAELKLSHLLQLSQSRQLPPPL